MGRVVEIDECLLHKRKYEKGRLKEEGWILGGIERPLHPEDTPRFFLVSLADRKAATLQKHIQEWVLPGTIIITDCFSAYSKLDTLGFYHFTVNHKFHFVDPVTEAHTQRIEGLWHIIRTHAIPKTGTNLVLLDWYLAAFMYRKFINQDFKVFLSDLGTVSKEILQNEVAQKNEEVEDLPFKRRVKLAQQKIEEMTKKLKEIKEKKLELEQNLLKMISSEETEKEGREEEKLRVADPPAKIEQEQQDNDASGEQSTQIIDLISTAPHQEEETNKEKEEERSKETKEEGNKQTNVEANEQTDEETCKRTKEETKDETKVEQTKEQTEEEIMATIKATRFTSPRTARWFSSPPRYWTRSKGNVDEAGDSSSSSDSIPQKKPKQTRSKPIPYRIIFDDDSSATEEERVKASQSRPIKRTRHPPDRYSPG